MSSTDEPQDGAYVAVRVPETHEASLWRRRDDLAATYGTGAARWLPANEPFDQPKTWAELCELGDIAGVAAFVNRSAKRGG